MQQIQELGHTEHDEIFKIFVNNDVEYTKNNNGIFVNLSIVNDAVLDTLATFVSFCMQNKAQLDEYDKAINQQRFLSMPKTAPTPMPMPSSHAVHAASPGAIGSGSNGGNGSSSGKHASHPHHNAFHQPKAAIQQTEIVKKNENAKFHQAKKRFSKRKVGSKDGETATSSASASNPRVVDELVAEPYLLNRL